MTEPLGCQNFQAQSVLTCNAEPIAICASRTKLFVATSSRTVEVHDLHAINRDQFHWFYTESLVTDLCFNEAGNYVTTIEIKETRNKTFKFVKVYLNWEADVSCRPIKARMSGDAGALNLPDLKQAEVIDVNYRGNLSSIATCCRTSNTAIAADYTVTLVRVVEKSLLKSGRVFRDVKPFAEISFEVSIEGVSLCEDYLAVSCPERAIVVRLSYHNAYQYQQRRHSNCNVAEASARTVSTSGSKKLNYDDKLRALNLFDAKLLKYSATTIALPIPVSEKTKPIVNPAQFPSGPIHRFAASAISANKAKQKLVSAETIRVAEDCIHWGFDSHSGDDDDASSSSVVFTKSVATKKVIVRKVPKSIHFKGLVFETVDTIKPTSDVNVKVTDSIEETVVDSVSVEVILNATPNDGASVKHLQLIPTYSTMLSPGMQYLSSGGSESLVGVSCYMGTEFTGYMYSLIPRPCLVSTYRFRHKALMVFCEPSRIHAITDRALDTYTARCAAVAARSVHSCDYVNSAFPNVEQDPEFICSQPFMDVQKITGSNGHVILLSKVSPQCKDSSVYDGNIWSLYILQNSSLTELYQEIVTLACQRQKTSAKRCGTLLRESFMLLKSLEISTPECHIEDLLCESAAMLGEFYMRRGNEDYKLTLPYLNMSLMSIDDIVIQATQFHVPADERQCCIFGDGILYYLDHTIFDETKSFPDIKQSTCDKIVKIFGASDPEKLPAMILFSNTKNFTPQAALEAVRCHDVSNANKKVQSERWLALCQLHLLCCEPELAEDNLAKVNTDLLLEVCVHYPKLIHTDCTHLSALAQLMRQHFPDLFIEVMMALLYNGSVPLILAIQMISGNESSDKLHEHTHVQLYLESLLADEEFEDLYQTAVMLLCNIYIVKLLTPHKATSIPPNRSPFRTPPESGHFGQRYSWLDNIPPLRGAAMFKHRCPQLKLTASHLGQWPRSIQQVKVSVPSDPCACCWCNEPLLKLQSLLCSTHTSHALRERVTQSLTDTPGLLGADSLRILCRLQEGVCSTAQLIVEKIPDILPEFVSSCFASDDLIQWRTLVDVLSDGVKKQLQLPEASQAVHLKAYKGVLSVMADTLTPPTFLSLLPSDGNLAFFSPYIQQCCHSNELKMLTWDIMQRGATLKSSM